MGSRLRQGISRRVLKLLRQEGLVIPLGASNMFTITPLKVRGSGTDIRITGHECPGLTLSRCAAWLGRSAILNSVSKH